jgi:hypothetical protein
MPPIRRKTKDTELNYRWTVGGAAGISHQQRIAHGRYGEVHKVSVEISKDKASNYHKRQLFDAMEKNYKIC